MARYHDEYEEGKAELVKIPRMQLKMLLREKLAQDGIRLSCQPYSTKVSCSCFFFCLSCGDVELAVAESVWRLGASQVGPRRVDV